MEELKPCPFCGKRGHIRLTKKTRGSQSGEHLQYFYVACGSPHCPVSMTTQTFVVEEHAIKAWNTRTESAELDKLKKRAIEAEEDMNTELTMKSVYIREIQSLKKEIELLKNQNQ